MVFLFISLGWVLPLPGRKNLQDPERVGGEETLTSAETAHHGGRAGTPAAWYGSAQQHGPCTGRSTSKLVETPRNTLVYWLKLLALFSDTKSNF